jgi:carbon monoxide dehydrogenase subunit G
MINFEISTLVDRPIEDVFAFLSNPLNTPKWQTMVKSIEQVVPGAVGIGAKFNAHAEVMGHTMEGLMEVTTYEPPTRFGFTNKAGPMEMAVAFALKPVGTGTKITLNIQGNPGGIFKLAEGPMTHQIKAQMEANLAKLKSVLEAMI